MAADARTAGASLPGARLGPRRLSWRRAGHETARPAGSLPRRPRMPGVPGDRRGRDRPEPSARLDGPEHGPALEPRLAGAAHWPGASPGPVAAGARRELRRTGNNRGRHVERAEVQALALRG